MSFLIPIGEAADVLGLSYESVRRLEREGKLTSSRPDGKTRHFDRREVEKLALEQPYSISKAASYMGISAAKLRSLEAEGKIPASRTSGGHRQYAKEVLDTYLNAVAPKPSESIPKPFVEVPNGQLGRSAELLRPSPRTRMPALLLTAIAAAAMFLVVVLGNRFLPQEPPAPPLSGGNNDAEGVVPALTREGGLSQGEDRMGLTAGIRDLFSNTEDPNKPDAVDDSDNNLAIEQFSNEFPEGKVAGITLTNNSATPIYLKTTPHTYTLDLYSDNTRFSISDHTHDIFRINSNKEIITMPGSKLVLLGSLQDHNKSTGNNGELLTAQGNNQPPLWQKASDVTVGNLTCDDCLSEQQIQDIYVKNNGDLITGALVVEPSTNQTILTLIGTGDQTDDYLSIRNQQDTRLFTVTSSGNVGIGTTAPDFKLQVAGHLGPQTDNVYNLGSASKRFANVYANNLIAGSISASFTPGSVLFADSSGNINQDNASLFFDDTNNRVGIGTTAPAGLLHVQASATPAFVVTSAGNIGIGTTAPAGLFHVTGQCVTGDTKLKRRKRKKCPRHPHEPNSTCPDCFEWQDVNITDIQPGDDILSLNENTGEFVPARVNALMDMGEQAVFQIYTQSRKHIRTTATHPYLVTHKPVDKRSRPHTTTFEVDQSGHVDKIGEDSVVALANKERAYAVTLDKKTKKTIFRELSQGKYKRHYRGPDILATLIIEAIRRHGISVTHLVIDEEYSGYEERIAETIRTAYPDIAVSFKNLGRTTSYAHAAAWSLNTRKTPAIASASLQVMASSDLSGSLAARSFAPTNGYVRVQTDTTRAASIPSSLSLSSHREWVLAKSIRPGMRIATVDGWEVISGIWQVGRERTWDIEIDGTHNFVGNDIVAHNTYLAASSGNVGIGTTTPEGLLAFEGDAGNLPRIRFQNDTGATMDAAISGYDATSGVYLYTGTNSWIRNDGSVVRFNTAEESSGILFDTGGSVVTMTGGTGANPTEKMRVDSAGNVGIGTTAPAGLLHVTGQCVTGDTKLKRRKRKKCPRHPHEPDADCPDCFEWQDVNITDIEPGDEILSLDEDTGEFVPARVNALMDMKEQAVFTLATQRGKTIRTTSNHPYLALPKKQSASTAYATVFEVDQSWRLEDTTHDTTIALANKNAAYTITVDRRLKRMLKTAGFFKKPRFTAVLFATLIALAVRKSGLKVTRLIIDQEYPSHERRMSAALASVLPTVSTSWTSIGRTRSFAHRAAITVFRGHQKPDLTIAAQKEKDRGQLLQKESDFRTLLYRQLRTADPRPHDLLQLLGYGEDAGMSSEDTRQAAWTQVGHLAPGMRIATVDGWESISAIFASGIEQTYDIEIEGTRNFVGNSIVAHNTYLAASSGNVGIGTTTPGAKLDIAGAAIISGTTNGEAVLTVGTPDTINAVINAPNNMYFAIDSDNNFSASNQAFHFKANGFYGTGDELMTILDTGNVGIGTTAPGYLLDVNGTANFAGAVTFASTTTSNGNITITKADPSIIFNTTTATDTDFWAGVQEDAAGTDDDLFQIGDGTTPGTNPFLTINTSGNVGIGTTAPQAVLDVNAAGGSGIKSFYFQASLPTDYYGEFTHYGNNSPGGLQITAQSQSAGEVGQNIVFNRKTGTSAAVPQMIIATSGNVGIGTTAPGYLLDVNGTANFAGAVTFASTTTSNGNITITKADPSIIFNTTTATDTDFWAGVQEDAAGTDDDLFQIGDGTTPGTNPHLTINTSGNVGIGTTAPNYSGYTGKVLSIASSADTAIEIASSRTTANTIIGGLSFVATGNTSNKEAATIAGALKGGTAGNQGAELRFYTKPDAGSLTQRMVIDSTGNVGIGTTAPGELFHLSGGRGLISHTSSAAFIVEDAGGTNILSVDTVTPQVTIGGNIVIPGGAGNWIGSDSGTGLTIDASYNVLVNGIAGVYVNLDSNNAGTAGNFVVGKDRAATSGGTDYFTILESSGNVGIGTTAPGSKLDVTTNSLAATQTASSGVALVNTTAATALAPVQISPALRWSGAGWKTDATAASQAVDFRSYVVPVQGTANPTGYLTFESSVNGGAYSTGQMVITSAGNVGIGITNPTSALQLPQENDATTPTLSFGDGDTGFYELSDDIFVIATAGAARFSISSTDFAGFAANAPAVRNVAATATVPTLIPNGGDSGSDTGIGWAGEDQLSLIAGGVEGIRIVETASVSNVGIGTTSPLTKLHVVGTELTSGVITGTSAGIMKISGGTYSASDVVALDFGSSDNTPAFARVGAVYTALGSYLHFGTSNAYASGITNTAMTIDYSGNVGIGDATPSQLLSVGSGDLFTVTSTGNVAGVQIAANDGLVTEVSAGACSDTTFTTDTDGTLCIDSSNNRLYYRYGAAWHYAAGTAGFQIPNMDRNGKNETAGLSNNSLVIGKIDEVLQDGALHGVWVSFDQALDQSLTQLLPEASAFKEVGTTLTAMESRITNQEASVSAVLAGVVSIDERLAALETTTNTTPGEQPSSTPGVDDDPPAPQSFSDVGSSTHYQLLTTNSLTVHEDATVYGTLLADTLESATSLVTHGDATIWGQLLVKGDVEIGGNAKVAGALTRGNEETGSATIPEGSAWAKVSFTESFAAAPHVTATLVGSGVAYTIDEVSPEGFTLTLLENPGADISFTWAAVSAEKKGRDVETGGSFEAATVDAEEPATVTPSPT